MFTPPSGGIAAVSQSLGNNIEYCEEIAQRRNADNLENAKTDADVYISECEQHPYYKPPKITVKVDLKTRKALEPTCIERGLPNQCRDLPNGGLEILTTARDKQGNRIVQITKPNGRTLYGTYDRNNKLRIRNEKDFR